MDKAILYNVTVEKINKRINSLKAIGFNVQEFENLRDNIINDSNVNIQNSYKFASPKLSLGQSAFLEQNYDNTINSLEKLYRKLLDYEVYVVAFHTTSLIKEFLSNNLKEEKDFIKYKEQLVLVLKNLHNSKTLDYNVEGPIIEEIYNVVYLFIKEEVSFLGYSELFESLGEVDKYYLDKLVRREVEGIDLKLKTNQEIKLKVKEIDANGYDDSYANRELISAIVESNLDKNQRKVILNALENNLSKYYYSLCDIYGDLKNITEPVSKSKKVGHLIGDSLKLAFHSALVTALLVGSFKLGKSASTHNDKTYMTKTTTYNPLNKDPYTITEQYEPKQDDSILATYYGPLVDGSMVGTYKRTVTTYNLSNYEGTPLEELYNMDLPSLMVPENSVTLGARDLSAEELMKEAFKIIKEVRVNLDDVKVTTKTSTFARGFYTLLFLAVSALIGLLYTSMINLAKEDDIDYVPFLSDLISVLEDLIGLLNQRQETEEYEKGMKDIVIRLDEIIKNNKPLIEKAMAYTNNLKDNKEYRKYIVNIAKSLELVNDKEKELEVILKK